VPAEASPDLIAGALARRDFPAAIQLLEIEKDRGFSNVNDFFLLTYLYCLNGSVEKAEALASAGAVRSKRLFVDWLWGDYRPVRISSTRLNLSQFPSLHILH